MKYADEARVRAIGGDDADREYADALGRYEVDSPEELAAFERLLNSKMDKLTSENPPSR